MVTPLCFWPNLISQSYAYYHFIIRVSGKESSESSQMHYPMKLGQNFVKYFVLFFGQWSLKKTCFRDLLTFNLYKFYFDISIFPLERQHYDSFLVFKPSSDVILMHQYIDAQHWEIQVKTWLFTLKGGKIWIWIWIKLELNWKFF